MILGWLSWCINVLDSRGGFTCQLQRDSQRGSPHSIICTQLAAQRLIFSGSEYSSTSTHFDLARGAEERKTRSIQNDAIVRLRQRAVLEKAGRAFANQSCCWAPPFTILCHIGRYECLKRRYVWALANEKVVSCFKLFVHQIKISSSVDGQQGQAGKMIYNL